MTEADIEYYYGSGRFFKDDFFEDEPFEETYYYDDDIAKYVLERESCLYLVDGDNDIYNAINNIGQIADYDKVYIYVSQKELKEKLENKIKNYHSRRNIQIILISPGPQAVDNVIKSRLGNEVKNKIYDRIFVISKDKGYENLIQKYRTEYGLKKTKLSRKEMI